MSHRHRFRSFPLYSGPANLSSFEGFELFWNHVFKQSDLALRFYRLYLSSSQELDLAVFRILVKDCVQFVKSLKGALSSEPALHSTYGNHRYLSSLRAHGSSSLCRQTSLFPTSSERKFRSASSTSKETRISFFRGNLETNGGDSFNRG